MGNSLCSSCSKNDDLSRGHQPPDKQRIGTIAPNMKNFKNLKYVENIEAIYKFDKLLGKGSYGKVIKATRIST